MNRRVDLPFRSKFSTSQVDLADPEGITKISSAGWHAFEDVVRARWLDAHATSGHHWCMVTNYTKLGIIAYGVIDRSASVTDIKQESLALRSKVEQLYDRLTKHVPLNLHGITLADYIADMETAGEPVVLTTLRKPLSENGLTSIAGASTRASCGCGSP